MPPNGSRGSLLTMPLMKRERADLGAVVLRISHLELLEGGDEALLEFGGDLFLDDEALGGDAALAGVLDARGHGGLDGAFEVGAGEDQKRIASAQLEHGLLQ